MGRLSGSVAVVTGGALGIGAATCRMMAREGASIAVTDIREEDGRALADSILREGSAARFWRLDVTDEANVEHVFADIASHFGRLDVLVNNAGIAGADGPPDEIGADDWEKVIAVNVYGVAFCTRHAIPHMRRAGRGSIINLSSIYGLVGAADLPPYHASKGAVRLMTKTDALFYAREGIRVNSVHPGFIWTPLVEGMARRSGQDPEAYRQDLARRHPVGRVGAPEDVAAGIVYLASDEARFVTGSELVIDGGYTAQ